MKKQPFFAKFLESQLSEDKIKQVKGGDCLLEPTTDKYPSDNEDGTILSRTIEDLEEHHMTKKYPSDLEDV